jgi:hypothetical protein
MPSKTNSAGALLATLTLISGCAFLPTSCRSGADSASPVSTAGNPLWSGHHAKCVIVFLDETGSVIADWATMRAQVAKIAGRLEPGDEFTVIAINDRSGEASNARVPLEMLQGDPMKTAELSANREVFEKQVLALMPKGHPARTDITGAITQALRVGTEAITMTKKQDSHSQMDIYLVFFSDMQQTPRMPTAYDLKDIHFPNGTKGYCYYVAAPGKKGIQSTVAIWNPLLNAAGVAMTETDFHQMGTVDAAIDTDFPPLTD